MCPPSSTLALFAGESLAGLLLLEGAVGERASLRLRSTRSRGIQGTANPGGNTHFPHWNTRAEHAPPRPDPDSPALLFSCSLYWMAAGLRSQSSASSPAFAGALRVVSLPGATRGWDAHPCPARSLRHRLLFGSRVGVAGS